MPSPADNREAERATLEAETDDRDAHAGYVAGKDPNFWLWTGWHDHGGLPSERPKLLPKRVPAWKLEKWEARYKLHRGAKRPPAPAAFAGSMLFTSHDPGVILRRRPNVKSVAVTLDLFNGVPGCTATMAAQLKIVGYTIFAWESRATLGNVAALELGAAGYIGQAESESELDRCLALSVPSGRPKALVGNVTAWTDAQQKRAREAGWELILEHYRNVQPWLKPDSRGYPVSSFCFGLYDGASDDPVNGRRILLRDYLAELPTADWSGYAAEYLTDEDWATIGAKP